MLSYSFDIFDELVESVRFCARALAVSAVVERQNLNDVAELAVDLEVGSMVTCGDLNYPLLVGHRTMGFDTLATATM